MQKKLQADLNAKFSEYSELLQKLYDLADKALAKAQSGTIAIIGVAVVVFHRN